MKIVFLGDSLTWGGYGGNVIAYLADELPQHTLINDGVGGNTVVNLLRRLDEALAHTPDAIFVMVGGNDAVSYCFPATRPYYRSAQGIADGFVSPQVFVDTYRELLTQLSLNHVLAWVATEPVEYNPTLIATMADYNQRLIALVNSMNIPLLDLAAEFMPQSAPERPPLDLGFIQEIGRREASGWDDYEAEREHLGYSYSFDGLHLTPSSAQRMAKRIAAFIKKQVS